MQIACTPYMHYHCHAFEGVHLSKAPSSTAIVRVSYFLIYVIAKFVVPKNLTCHLIRSLWFMVNGYKGHFEYWIPLYL